MSLYFTVHSHLSIYIFICSSEQIYHDFVSFGKIGDFYRPKLLDHHVPSRFLFIRYYRSDDGYRAMMEMHGKVYGDRIITVHEANDQDSYFTQDTGEYIYVSVLLHSIITVNRSPIVVLPLQLPVLLQSVLLLISCSLTHMYK